MDKILLGFHYNLHEAIVNVPTCNCGYGHEYNFETENT